MHEVQERLQALLGGEYELLARLDQSGLGLEAATAEMRNRTRNSARERERLKAATAERLEAANAQSHPQSHYGKARSRD